MATPPNEKVQAKANRPATRPQSVPAQPGTEPVVPQSTVSQDSAKDDAKTSVDAGANGVEMAADESPAAKSKVNHSGGNNLNANKAAKAETGNQGKNSVPNLAPAESKLFFVHPNNDLQPHAATTAYPILPHNEEAMRHSLEHDGQSDPITILAQEEKLFIIDGNTRVKIAREINLPLLARVIVADSSFDAVEWVAKKFRASDKSRKMTSGQLGILAADLVGDFQQDDEPGKSHIRAADAVGAKRSATRQGLKVIQYDYLREAVMADEVPISVAAAISEVKQEEVRKEALAAAKGSDKQKLNDLLDRQTASTDAEGRQVPSGLAPLVVASNRIEKTLSKIDAAIKNIDSIADKTDGIHVATTQIAVAVQRIRNSIPKFLCDGCDADGDDCPWCERTGVLSEKRRAEFKHASRSLQPKV